MRGAKRDILAVSELNRQAKRLLETHFDQVWVQGEISNLARPQSGHWYLSLKDSRAQVRCAMFKNRNSLLRFNPKEGDEVIARGRISIYEGRGDYQLIIENMQPAGAGALQQQLEDLKSKLMQEGLFAAEAKQMLPSQAQHIAIVSSASGAVLQDILSVFKRRAPQVLLSLYPVAVQGADSAPQLLNAIRTLSSTPVKGTPALDAIIVARGGGSLEDLWSFNDEQLARAIFACPIPVVSAVGHETDFTICDLVADVRAPTPSAAAELLSPDSAELLLSLGSLANRLHRAVQQRLRLADRDLGQARRLLRHPGRRLEDHNQRCDELSERLHRAGNAAVSSQHQLLNNMAIRLSAQSPEFALKSATSQLTNNSRRLIPAMHAKLETLGANLAHHARVMHTVSPLATLERGYSIVEVQREGQQPKIARSVSSIKEGDQIKARLADGTIEATVSHRTPLQNSPLS